MKTFLILAINVVFVLHQVLVTEATCANNTMRAKTGCDQYEICFEGETWITMDCAYGTLFDVDNQTCVHSYTVNTTTCQSFSQDVYTICANQTMRSKNGSDCAKYEICFEGLYWIEMDCPYGTLFDDGNNTCLAKSIVNPDTCRSDPPFGNGCAAGSFRATPGTSCGEFQRCLDTGEWSYSMSCPNGTLWSNGIKTCDFEHNVNTSICVTSTSLSAECSQGDFLATPDSNCTMFKMCLSNGMWSENQLCPRRTLFEISTNTCQFRRNVNKRTCTIKNAASCSPGEAKGLTGCTEFVVCDVLGVWSQVPTECPTGLYFNGDIQGCDNLSNVDLGTCTTI